METLPNELLSRVLKYLTNHDVKILATISRVTDKLFTPFLWRNIKVIPTERTLEKYGKYIDIIDCGSELLDNINLILNYCNKDVYFYLDGIQSTESFVKEINLQLPENTYRFKIKSSIHHCKRAKFPNNQDLKILSLLLKEGVCGTGKLKDMRKLIDNKIMSKFTDFLIGIEVNMDIEYKNSRKVYKFDNEIKFNEKSSFSELFAFDIKNLPQNKIDYKCIKKLRYDGLNDVLFSTLLNLCINLNEIECIGKYNNPNPDNLVSQLLSIKMFFL